MKKLLLSLKFYKKECVIAPLFKMLEAIFELLVPLIVADIIDVGVPANDGAYIFRRVLLMIAFGVIGLSCTLIAQYFAARAAVGFGSLTRRALHKHIFTLSYSELDNIGTDTLLTRLTSDINQVQNCVNLTIRLLLRSPFIVFGAMVMAFTVDKKSATTFAVMIPLLSVIVFGIMILTIPLYKKVQLSLEKVMSKTRGNLSGVRVIRAFCRQEGEIDEFEAENNLLNRLNRLTARICALQSPLTFAVVNLAVVALIYTGALRVDAGDLSQGQLVALYNYMSQILIELVKLASLIITITKSVACGNRIQAVFDTAPSMKSGNKKIAKIEEIQFSNVSFCYPKSSDNAINNISFKAKQGQTVGILGGTGAGKSTLINLIPRFYDITSGDIQINGRSISQYDLNSLRNRIAVVPQKASLVSGSIRDNLLWGNKNATDEDLLTALQVTQAKDFVMEKQGGFDFELSASGTNLSGGQRQRLTIARALVRKPDVLIMDDSLSALDYATDLKLRTALRNIENPPLTFIVTQRASSIVHADAIIVLDDGEAVGVGTHSELLDNCEVYREIYYSQFEKGGAR